ncbi:hypothetical protein CJ204_02520 [Corynebacterium xerosis]|uniref:Right handed beta helix domain-containing protein n=1 Tax=Corynebacterium xerosis TaxID=1725 RepID=A0A2N6T1B9_9CORY|nr:right-handed parallel beta-helix repeat-containing protein [Corynebacterium xerosis]PMC63118.1 hypothetical protein CJ204_02520 [Corynebacterium xerosis]
MSRNSTASRVILVIVLVLFLATAIFYVVDRRMGDRTVEIHVSATGDDAASGSSAEEAWRTLDRVSDAEIEPGTVIVVHGRVPGTLNLSGRNGTADDPIVVTSAPEKRGIIAAEDVAGIRISDSSYVTVRDIDVVDGSGLNDDGDAGQSPESAAKIPDGIVVWASTPGARGAGIRIERVAVEGLRNGIAVGAAGGGAGFDGVTVSHVAAVDNIRNGILFYSDELGERAHTDVNVSYSKVSGTTGITGATGNTGSGIVIGAVDGGVVEHNVAEDNGRLSDAVEGPIGIWAYSSSRVAIRNNLAEDNKTSNADGGGFAIDVDVDNSALIGNISRDNMGPGYLVFANSGLPTADNAVMFNASIDDSTNDSFHGAISVHGGLPQSPEGSTVEDLYIAHNTVVIGADSPAPALSIDGDVTGAEVIANFFDVRGYGGVIGARTLKDSDGAEFRCNAYSPGTGSAVGWLNGVTYIDFTYWWDLVDDPGSAVTDATIDDPDAEAADLIPDSPVTLGRDCEPVVSGDTTDLAGRKTDGKIFAGAVRP